MNVRGLPTPTSVCRGAPLASNLFTDWIEPVTPTMPGVALHGERAGTRVVGLAELKRLLADHFVGEQTVMKMGGYAKAALAIANSLPTSKRTRSGDLGELIATEYVDALTSFRVPIRKLRWKSDREMPMHGNDVIAIDVSGARPRVLKGESKSRVQFSAAVVADAVTGLETHDGRPNPSTMAFIAKRLYEENRDAEAAVFQGLQADGALAARNVRHLIFALAGKDPSKHLAGATKPNNSNMKREAVAVIVDDHAGFVADVYAGHGAKP